MKINIPCSTCGCQTCDAESTDGETIAIEICHCPDGSGDFDVTITPQGGDPLFEKHSGPIEDLEDHLAARYKINLDSIEHNCN